MNTAEKKHSDLLNSTMRSLTTLFRGRGVTLLKFDVNAIGRFNAARDALRSAFKNFVARNKRI